MIYTKIIYRVQNIQIGVIYIILLAGLSLREVNKFTHNCLSITQIIKTTIDFIEM